MRSYGKIEIQDQRRTLEFMINLINNALPFRHYNNNGLVGTSVKAIIKQLASLPVDLGLNVASSTLWHLSYQVIPTDESTRCDFNWNLALNTDGSLVGAIWWNDTITKGRYAIATFDWGMSIVWFDTGEGNYRFIGLPDTAHIQSPKTSEDHLREDAEPMRAKCARLADNIISQKDLVPAMVYYSNLANNRVSESERVKKSGRSMMAA